MPEETEPEPTEPEVVEPEVLYFDVPLSENLQDHIFELCEERDLDPALVIAVIWRESTFKASTVGDSGDSLGLMQIQAKWHQHRMDEYDCQDLLDPYQNVTVGIDILADYFAKGRPVEWVLMAYNGGGNYANRKWKNGEISSYATAVLNYKETLEFREG
jgi:soluble lytic murein transglycosylase-like protein